MQHNRFVLVSMAGVGLCMTSVLLLVPISGCGDSIQTLTSQHGLCDIEQIIGDCKKKQCSGDGTVISIIDDTDVPQPDPNSVCRKTACNNGEPEYGVIADQGTPCHGGVCSAGECVECVDDSHCPDQERCMVNIEPPKCTTHCNDNIQNEDEEAIDCGGSCGKCADGTNCNNDSMCQSGYCVDGFCCANACNSTCFTCGKQGLEGSCQKVSAGQPDDDTCTNGKICNGGDALCGLPCAKNTDCPMGQKCTGLVCQ